MGAADEGNAMGLQDLPDFMACAIQGPSSFCLNAVSPGRTPMDMSNVNGSIGRSTLGETGLTSSGIGWRLA